MPSQSQNKSMSEVHGQSRHALPIHPRRLRAKTGKWNGFRYTFGRLIFGLTKRQYWHGNAA